MDNYTSTPSPIPPPYHHSPPPWTSFDSVVLWLMMSLSASESRWKIKRRHPWPSLNLCNIWQENRLFLLSLKHQTNTSNQYTVLFVIYLRGWSSMFLVFAIFIAVLFSQLANSQLTHNLELPSFHKQIWKLWINPKPWTFHNNAGTSQDGLPTYDLYEMWIEITETGHYG